MIETRSSILDISSLLNFRIDVLVQNEQSDFESHANELYELLSLVRLGSPRVESGDQIDAYLSRYSIPDIDTKMKGQCNLAKITWQGFFPATWVQTLIFRMVLQLPSQSWFSLSSTTVSRGDGINGGSEVMMFKPPNSADRYVLWEVK
jgi:ribonucleases P/MRP protein subunit RPP40